MMVIGGRFVAQRPHLAFSTTPNFLKFMLGLQSRHNEEALSGTHGSPASTVTTAQRGGRRLLPFNAQYPLARLLEPQLFLRS